MLLKRYPAQSIFFLSVSLILFGGAYLPYGPLLEPLVAAIRKSALSAASSVRYVLWSALPDAPHTNDAISAEQYRSLVRDLSIARQAAGAPEGVTNGVPLTILRREPNGTLFASAAEAENLPRIDFVVDEQLALVGIAAPGTRENDRGIIEIQTIFSPLLEFSVARTSGKRLGLARYQEIGFLKVEFLTPDIEFTSGETVVTAGDDAFFPPGIPVGRIEEVKSGGYYQTIIIRPFFSLSESPVIVGKELVARDKP